ncbi:UDP-glucose 4-epimerase GalE [Candidatus Peregrinibacteria bacterium]|nr:UDP-glucose 4-epimerase GalE [Candidatus Peregrinibacteria bacterium]
MTERKILIVGGAGYIGSHVNKHLFGNGYSTVVFDNLSTGYRELVKWGDFFKGDLEDVQKLEACFKKYRIEAVMHFGASAYVGESVILPSKYYKNNVANTLNLLDVMNRFDVKKIIFSSSCAIYGKPAVMPIKENFPFNPINPYGRTKKMVEEILGDYEIAYGIKHINLRYFNAAGADPESEIGEMHNPETHLIPLVLAAASGHRKNVKIFGVDYNTKDGTCVRDYVHVSDLASAHLLALQYLVKGGGSESFNLGNGQGFSVREVIEAVEKVSGKRIKYIEVPRRPGDPPVLIATSDKARKTLKWLPQYFELNQIIGTAWEWHKHDIYPSR